MRPMELCYNYFIRFFPNTVYLVVFFSNMKTNVSIRQNGTDEIVNYRAVTSCYGHTRKHPTELG